MSDNQAEPGFVKNKIKVQTTKKGARVARARKEQWPKSLAKVIKKAISISELLTEEDQNENLRVIREAKHATHRVFDPVTKTLVEVPDTKCRLAGVALDLAYREGRPVERQVQVRANFEDLASMQERVRNSPEAMRLLRQMAQPAELPAIDSLQSGPTVTGGERLREGPELQDRASPDAEK